MNIILTDERQLLPVVDAIDLIARHSLGCDEHHLIADNIDWLLTKDIDWQVLSEPQNRPAPDIALVAKERVWSGHIRQAATSGMLPLYDARGYRIEYDPDAFAFGFACVKPSHLMQWLIDAYGKDCVLDGVQVEPTPVSNERETLKRDVLVERFWGIWPSIEADLQEGSRNELMAAAGLEHGIYDVQRALRWARTRGKVRVERAGPESMNDLPAAFFPRLGGSQNNYGLFTDWFSRETMGSLFPERSTMTSDFHDDFSASRHAEKHPTVVAALRDAFPGALQVHRAHKQNDQLGVDVFLEYSGARMYGIDLKIRRVDHAAPSGAAMDVVLELTFGDRPGWAMRPTKAEGYLFVCLDTGRCAAFAADVMRLALERNLTDWSGRFRTIETETKAFNGGPPIISKAIIVPSDVLTAACEAVREQS